MRNFFLFLLAFLGIGALGGGAALIISPTGELLQLPLSTFNNMPFSTFLIPGIVLFIVLGVAPLLLIGALLKRPDSVIAERINLFKDMHWSWTFSIHMAFILMGWIHIQLIFLQGKVYWLHTFYMGYGALMILVALSPSMRAAYRRSDFQST